MIVNPKVGRVMAVAGFILITIAPDAGAVGSTGFENASLSTRSLSRCNASVADAEGPDSVAFNPALLSKLEGVQVYGGNSLINIETHYEGIRGRNNEDASETIIPVPFFYMSCKLTDKLGVGVGGNSPFGLANHYSSTGNFRYIAYYNQIVTQAYHVSVGYEVRPGLAVGAGWTGMEMKLKQVGKFHSVFLTGDNQDAPFEYDVSGQGHGWNLGLMWDVTDNDRLGAFYRSEVRQHLKGTMSTHDMIGVIAAVFGGPSNVTSADTDVRLPANITVGWNHAFSEKFNFEADVGFTFWNSYDTFDSTFGTSNAVLVGFEHLVKDFEDVLSFHFGGSYDLNSDWTISAGYLFYQSAANENTYTNEIPDGNKHGFSVGIRLPISDWSFDVMYLGMLVVEEEIENISGISNGTDIDGSYSGFIQLLTTGMSYRF